MIADILRDRITRMRPRNALEQENLLVEALQHIILVSLARARFFQTAIFHGGTCLRIVHRLARFSEDLDFLSKEPNPAFRWHPFTERLGRDCVEQGLEHEIRDKSAENNSVKKAWLTFAGIGAAIGGLEQLNLTQPRDHRRQVRIKLELDSNPPLGSTFETRYIGFPSAAALTTQSMDSSFAIKLHALLCRPYTKGRDWYDLLWYLERDVLVDARLLHDALKQVGPWAGQTIPVNRDWVLTALKSRIDEIDWNQARDDVARFLPMSEVMALELWSREYFLDQVDRLAANW